MYTVIRLSLLFGVFCSLFIENEPVRHNFEVYEYDDMVECYIRKDYNGAAAQRLYAQLHPERHLPKAKTIMDAYHRLRETGNVRLPAHREQALPADLDDLSEQIMEAIANEPTISIRELERRLRRPRSVIHRILQSLSKSNK